jgi:ribosomal protein L11
MELNKTVINTAKFQVLAGRADSKGALGPVLSQVQVNANTFCEEFNDRTIGLDLFEDQSVIVKVSLKQFDDKSSSFVVLKPSVSNILRLATGIKQGNSSGVAGSITLSQLIAIAKFKYKGFNLHSACSMVLGTAKSMGIKLVK